MSLSSNFNLQIDNRSLTLTFDIAHPLAADASAKKRASEQCYHLPCSSFGTRISDDHPRHSASLPPVFRSVVSTNRLWSSTVRVYLEELIPHCCRMKVFWFSNDTCTQPLPLKKAYPIRNNHTRHLRHETVLDRIEPGSGCPGYSMPIDFCLMNRDVSKGYWDSQTSSKNAPIEQPISSPQTLSTTFQVLMTGNRFFAESFVDDEGICHKCTGFPLTLEVATYNTAKGQCAYGLARGRYRTNSTSTMDVCVGNLLSNSSPLHSCQSVSVTGSPHRFTLLANDFSSVSPAT